MKNYKFSVIIPAYNAERYLTESVNSALNQNYSNFEVIIVDDGSNDSTWDEIEKIKRNNKNVQAIHQDNKGQVSARLNGVNYAHSDYCLFLDSDDLFTKDALKKINDSLNIFEADVVIFNAYKFNERNKVAFWPEYKNTLWYGYKDVVDEIKKEAIKTKRFNNICFKCYKTKILQNTKPIDESLLSIRFEEDLLMQLPYLDVLNSAMYFPEKLYLYRDNPNSITNSYVSGEFEMEDVKSKYLRKYAKKWRINNYDVYCNTRYLYEVTGCIIGFWNNEKPNYSILKQYINKISNDKYYRRIVNSKNNLDFGKRVLLCNIYQKRYFIVYFLLKVRYRNIYRKK